MSQIDQIKALFSQAAEQSTISPSMFFKIGEGHYASHDKFLGIPVPELRKIAKEFAGLPLGDIKLFLTSPFNEERMFALILLVNQYQKSDEKTREQIFNFYLNNLQYVNNWNLVDCSAHLIFGRHLFGKDVGHFFLLTKSADLWERRIAVVASWYFIKKNSFDLTLQLAENLMTDQHDLMHKACGWMLREVGKKNEAVLRKFLDLHAARMPRTMLRYAIEKFADCDRGFYLSIARLKES